MKMKTAIIILNWKGAAVTIECMESLLVADGDFFVIVTDNGSQDGSVEQISQWMTQKNISNKLVAEGAENGVTCECGEMLLYSLNENYGFAKGNNKAIALAMNSLPDNILLLNNDTVVNSDFLVKLIRFREKHPDYKVLTPLINFFFDKELVWNAGGVLRYGFRKYYYGRCKASEIKEREFIEISFVTGCALLVPATMLDDDKKLLTERFFFGEEDFEFSLRMAKSGMKMACVLNSLIYHKVGTSLQQKHNIPGKIYIHFLNRFIDVRLHYSKIFFFVWRFIYKPYIALLLHKKGCTFAEINSFISRLYNESKTKSEVTYGDFVKALSQDWCGKEITR